MAAYGFSLISKTHIDISTVDFNPSTVRQFIELGTVIDADEIVRFGIIDADAPASAAEWKSVTKLTTLNVDLPIIRSTATKALSKADLVLGTRTLVISICVN